MTKLLARLEVCSSSTINQQTYNYQTGNYISTIIIGGGTLGGIFFKVHYRQKLDFQRIKPSCSFVGSSIQYHDQIEIILPLDIDK